MATTINPDDIKRELLYELRNADILTISERNVSTTTDSGTWTADTSHLINVQNGKNIRSITVGGSPLTYGDDYDYNIDFDDSGTIKIKVTLVSAQTGDYVITYDYGTDRIFPDFPKSTLDLSEFPRVSIDLIGGTTEIMNLTGEKTKASYRATVVVYSSKQSKVESTIQNIRTFLLINKRNLYFSYFISPTDYGPIVKNPFGKNKILQRNQDAMIEFIFESE